jgi:hypothetical protein
MAKGENHDKSIGHSATKTISSALALTLTEGLDRRPEYKSTLFEAFSLQAAFQAQKVRSRRTRSLGRMIRLPSSAVSMATASTNQISPRPQFIDTE